jgi:hypothetical protein
MRLLLFSLFLFLFLFSFLPNDRFMNAWNCQVSFRLVIIDR